MAAPVATSLSSAGFQEMDSAAPSQRRLILSTEALEKHGKSHFALTAPGPIAYINLDRPLGLLLPKFPNKVVKQFVLADPGTLTLTVAQHEARWEKVKAAYLSALAAKDIRTVVVDTATALWKLIRFAEFGKLSQVPPQKYDQVNADFAHLISLSQSADKNVLFLHKKKEEWKDSIDSQGKKKSSPSGTYKREGFADLAFIVETVIEHLRNPADGEFAIRILESGHNGRLKGAVICPTVADGILEAEMGLGAGLPCDFSTLAQVLIPDSTPEEWE